MIPKWMDGWPFVFALIFIYPINIFVIVAINILMNLPYLIESIVLIPFAIALFLMIGFFIHSYISLFKQKESAMPLLIRSNILYLVFLIIPVIMILFSGLRPFIIKEFTYLISLIVAPIACLIYFNKSVKIKKAFKKREIGKFENLFFWLSLAIMVMITLFFLMMMGLWGV